jgi:hypothetical protein
MLVGADDAAIDEVEGPIEGTARVSFGLESVEHPLPHAGRLPATEAAVHGLPLAVSVGQISPRHARAQPPDDPVKDLPMVLVRPAYAGLGSRQ